MQSLGYRHIQSFLFIGTFIVCCKDLYIDLSASSDSRSHSLTGSYQSYTTYNGRSAYKHKDKSRYLFYIDDSKGRWVIEDELGKNQTAEGVEFHGLLRHEGDSYCPENVGPFWSHVWDRSVVDPAIVVKCDVPTGSKCICKEMVSVH